MIAVIHELEVLGAPVAAAPCGLADNAVAGLSDQDTLVGLVLAITTIESCTPPTGR